MDDKDHVFARFKDDKTTHNDRRETLTIPRRAGASGNRVVEVVYVRSAGALKERPRRVAAHLHAASWDEGFLAKRPLVAPILADPTAVEVPARTAHVMPAWEPATPPPALAQLVEVRRGRGRPRKESNPVPTRHVADPFDASDHGANCMRCGYAIEPARERRGLMTCSECG